MSERPRTVRQQFADTLLRLGRADPRLVVLLGDISSAILKPFAQACPGRFYNVGICEPTIVGMAAGLSKMGFHPVVHTIAPFLIERAFEQIKLDFSYQRLGGNLVSVGGAFDYSNLGCTHHSYGDFALLKTLEGVEIVCPGNAEEFDLLFEECYADGRLTHLRIPARQHRAAIPREAIRLGKGVRVAEGRELTLVAVGPQLESAAGAREPLRARGWEPEIIYLHTVLPLDVDLVRDSARKTRRVLVIEEHMQSGGAGDDVLRAIHGIDGVRFSSLSIPGRFVREYGTLDEQLERLGLTPRGVVERVERDFARAG